MTAQYIKTMLDPGTVIQIRFEGKEEPQAYKIVANNEQSYLKKVGGENRLPIWDFVHATYLDLV